MKRTCIVLMVGILFASVGLYSVPASADERIVFSYQCTNDIWWTGLVLVNGPDVTSNTLTVDVLDQNGFIAATGTVTFSFRLQQRVGQLGDLTSGSIPQRGAIRITGAYEFSATEIIGNDSGGFGVSEQKSELIP